MTLAAESWSKPTLNSILSLVKGFAIEVLDLQGGRVNAIQRSCINSQVTHGQALEDRDPTNLAEVVRICLWTEKVRRHILLALNCG